MRAILSVLLILITGACSVTPERLAEALNDSSAQEFRESSFVPVYIATTRAASNALWREGVRRNTLCHMRNECSQKPLCGSTGRDG